MRQAIFKTLILVISFRQSDSINQNPTITCRDVSRFHPGVPPGQQLGSWAEAAKTGT